VNAVLVPTASDAEWLEARRQGITASEIAVVMGLSPYSSPFALYHQKLGQLPQQADNVEMELGRYLESFVADRFAGLHDEVHLSGTGRELYACYSRPWQLATPDRIVSDIRFDFIEGVTDAVEEYEPYAVLETKTDAGYDGWGEDGSDEIPVHYRCQVLWQMDVMGVTTGFVACLFLHSRTLRVYELTMDDAARGDLKLMREEAREFLDRIDLGDPPDVDWRPATTAALKHLHPSLEDRQAIVPKGMARAYAAACGRYKSAEQSKKRLENQIRQRLGAANAAVLRDGTKVAARQVYEVREHTRKASTVDKLVPSKIKEEAR
jgi:putative phage-type endonuclease